jgi:ribonuclease Z
MIWEVKAGPYSIRGVSVGGVYTSLHVPELGVLFDVGIAPRHFAAVDDIFLSHAHADHVGALVTLMGLRGLSKRPPPRVHLPEEIAPDIQALLATATNMQRYDMAIEAHPMTPGQEALLRGDVWMRALRTHHPVPSLGYQFFRRVKKLRAAFVGLPGPEIARRRQAGEALFDEVESLELAYVTDTLVRVLDTSPFLGRSRVLVIECSFLDERKSLADSRAGCHIHLDELLQHAERLQNDAIVLMHFSQIYAPDEVRGIIRRRCPPEFAARIVAFAPETGQWP